MEQQEPANYPDLAGVEGTDAISDQPKAVSEMAPMDTVDPVTSTWLDRHPRAALAVNYAGCVAMAIVPLKLHHLADVIQSSRTHRS